MKPDFDVIIAGLGAMGSATAYHLARRGARVLGLDRFHPPHDRGSSHGLTRIIREAYFEHPLYVPLVQRAYELWATLEKESGRTLFLQTGGLMLGPAEGVIVGGARRSAVEHKLPHQILSSAELRERYPALNPSPETIAVLEARAGMVFPELAIQTHLELAGQSGATLYYDQPIVRWESLPAGVRVSTATGSFTASKLLISAGAWLGTLVAELNLPLSVERQILFWYDVGSQAELFKPDRLPIFLWEYEPHKFFYGFPDVGDGFKIALHHQGEKTTPDQLRREVTQAEIEQMRSLLARFLPAATGPLKSATVCMYTNTPDENFILDFHPQHPQVLIASPCSGHGFKFSSAIGETAADLLTRQSSRFDLTPFQIKRF